MRGKKKGFIVLIGLLIAMVWAGSAWAIEYGNFSMSGWVRNQIAYNIGHSNPYNANYDAYYGNDDFVHFKMIKTSVQLKPLYKFSDSVSVFGRVLAANEQANWDKNVRTPPDGWFPKDYDLDLQDSSDNWMLACKEIYADFDSEYVWLRIGKQQVAWGQSDGLRLLDIINPLDKTMHGVSLNEPFLDGFDNLRESLWMVRLTFKSPWETENLQDLQLELLWLPGDLVGSEFVGHTNAQIGSPYHFIGDIFHIYNETPSGQQFGARLMGKYIGLEWSLNYFRSYTDDSLLTNLRTETYYPWLPANSTVAVDGNFLRTDTFGFSASYDENRFTKAVYRLEAIYQDKPFEENLFSADPGYTRRKTISALLGIDRPTIIQWLNPTRAISLGFQAVVLQVVEDGNDMRDDNLTIGGCGVTDNVTMFSFSATTGYMQDRINPQLLYIYDTGRQGHYFQGGVEFRFTDNILWYVGATLYDGKNSADGAYLGYDDFAHLETMDEVQSRITFQF